MFIFRYLKQNLECKNAYFRTLQETVIGSTWLKLKKVMDMFMGSFVRKIVR